MLERGLSLVATTEGALGCIVTREGFRGKGKTHHLRAGACPAAAASQAQVLERVGKNGATQASSPASTASAAARESQATATARHGARTYTKVRDDGCSVQGCPLNRQGGSPLCLIHLRVQLQNTSENGGESGADAGAHAGVSE